MAPASYFGRVVSLVVFSLSYAFADHEHGGLRGDGHMGQTSSQAIHQALNNVHQTCRADLYSLCLNSASNPGSRRTLQEVRPPMGRQSLHHPGHGYAEGYGDHLGHGHGGPEGYGPPHHHHHNLHDMGMAATLREERGPPPPPGMGMGGPAGPGGFWEPPPGMRDHAMPAREMGFDDEGPWEWASEVSDPSMVVESGEPVQLESFWPELEWVSQVQEEGWRTGWSGSSSSASTDESASADSDSFSSSDGSVSSDSVSSDSSSSDDSASWDWLTAAAASVLRARRRFLGQRAAAAPSPDAGVPRRRLVMMHPAMKEALLAEQQLAAAAEEEEEEEGPAALGAARRPPARASHGSRAGAADHLLPVLRDRAAARGAHGRGAPVARKAGGGGGGGGEAAAGGPEGVPAPPQRLDGKAQQQAAPAHGSKPQPAPKPLPAKGPTDKPHRALAAQPRAPTPVLPPLGGPPRPVGNPPGGNGGNRRALMHQHGHKEWHAQWGGSLSGSSDSSDSWDSSSSDSSSSDDLGYRGYPGHYAYAPLGFGRADDQCLYDHLAAGELGAGCEAAVEQLQTAYLGALAAETARAEAEADDCASFALGLLGLLLVAYVCRAAGLRRRLARCAPTHRVVQDHPELKAAVAEILQAHPEAYRGPACKVRCLVGAVAAVLSYALALFLLVSFLALGGGEEVEDEGDALFVSFAIAFLSCAVVALPLKAALRRRQRRARREAAGARAIAVQVGGPEGRAAGYAPLPLEEPGAPHSGDSQRVVFAGVPVTAPPLPNLTLHTVQVV